ncbi:MAG: YifB family Mg chelatase-like AAA ATPase [Deltaproteobacteria bacterium]|nr:YifB family Mg chelatase-like AAA ATPase [Deltaproteobacteria bacterium]
MIAITYTGSLWGLCSQLITVEVDLQSNIPSFNTVGLPDGMIKESKERIKAALQNSGLSYPQRRIVVNLAPADLRKEGSTFDLPITIGILAAHKKIPLSSLQNTLFIGELSLTGQVKPVQGILSHLLMAKKQRMTRVIMPLENLKEASLFDDIEILGVESLLEAVSFLQGMCQLTAPLPERFSQESKENVDFSHIVGHEEAKRVLEIAVAGRHNVFFIGPPGAGKTILAKAVASLLPSLTNEEVLEVLTIRSVLKKNFITTLNPPFVAPHHTVSYAALCGGGSVPKPGLVTEAHRGVLFLDEVGEFQKRSLEVLRQVLEERKITVARAAGNNTFPADFLLIMASNPCPCGYHTHEEISCYCAPTQIAKYQSKFSGPLLDRIDLHLHVSAVKKYFQKEKSAPSSERRERILEAQKFQRKRYESLSIRYNSQIPSSDILKCCDMDKKSELCLETAVKKMNLSHRSFHGVLKVARTIADLDCAEMIQEKHLLEALQYRQFKEFSMH